MGSNKAVCAAVMVTALVLGGCSTSNNAGESHGAGRPGGAITIDRDMYGVPHVYADDVRSVFEGYGYAVAEDRLFQMEMALRSSIGTAAEVLGPEYVQSDMDARTSIDPQSIHDQLAALPPEKRDIFEGYAEGYNRRVDEVLKNRGKLLPKQFLDYGLEPQRWSSDDVVMVWVQTMANRFSGSTSELANLKVLDALVQARGPELGRELFDQLNWPDEDPNAPTTVPRKSAESSTPTAHAHAAGLVGVTLDLPDSNLRRMKRAGGGGWPHVKPDASNVWLVSGGKSADGTSILVNGPQFGWFNPSYVYGIGLHGGGFDVVGNTPFAIPTVLFATNGTIAWGSTAGPRDVNDVYQEKLNPENPHEYMFNGEYQKMDARGEAIAVKGREPVDQTIYSTVHGRVTSFDIEKNTAYTLKSSWAGKELQTLIAYIDLMKAKNWDQFLEQAKKVGITNNWYYSDDKGNIGYVSPGYVPIRPDSQDRRLPAVGDGTMEWQGIRPFDEAPKVFNPDQGFIANWNNQSAADELADGYIWSAVDRVNKILDRLADRKDLTPGQVWDINRDASFADLNIDYLLPFLAHATSHLDKNDPVAQAATLLQSWDGLNVDQNGDGMYDGPQPTIMRAWLPILFEAVLKDDLPDSVYQPYATNIYAAGGSMRPAEATKIVQNALLGDKSGVPQKIDLLNGAPGDEIVLKTFSDAVTKLRTEHGPNPQAWQTPVIPHPFDYKNYLGVPQAGLDETLSLSPYMNRGTENDLVVLGKDIAHMCTAMPPGQSGFIAPDGTRSAHYADQMDLYRHFQCKDEALSREDVVATLQNRTTLNN